MATNGLATLCFGLVILAQIVTSQNLNANHEASVGCSYLCRWSDGSAGARRAVLLAGCRCADFAHLANVDQLDVPLTSLFDSNDGDVTAKRKRQFSSLDYGLDVPWSKNGKQATDVEEARKVFRYGRK